MYTTELITRYAVAHARIKEYILRCARADSTYLDELEDSDGLRCANLQAQLLARLRIDYPDADDEDLASDATMQRARIVGDALRSLIDNGSLSIRIDGCIDSSTTSGIGLSVCIEAIE